MLPSRANLQATPSATPTIIHVKWKSRTAGFVADDTVNAIVVKARNHFKLSAHKGVFALVAKFNGQELEVTDDTLHFVADSAVCTLSKVQEEEDDEDNDSEEPRLGAAAAPPAQMQTACADPASSSRHLRHNSMPVRGRSKAKAAARKPVARMCVYVRGTTGKKTRVTVEASDTVGSVKSKAGAVANAATIKLYHRGQLLDEDQTLSSCGIGHGDTVLSF